MEGKTCIVTGATGGIGRATARALCERGAHVVIVCRDEGRGRDAAAEFAAAVPGAQVDIVLGDFASQRSTTDAAREILSRFERIDVLVNNAAVVNATRTETEDGLEEVFAVNQLGYFLFTNLLLDRIRASAPARIVNVASDAHRFGELDLEDLQSERAYKIMRVYGASKRANILFSYELARRLADAGVTVNCLHPGAVGTGLAGQNGWWARAILLALKPFFRSADRGAETSVYLAASPEVEGVTGKYYSDKKELRSHEATYDRALATELWQKCAELTKLEERLGAATSS